MFMLTLSYFKTLKNAINSCDSFEEPVVVSSRRPEKEKALDGGTGISMHCCHQLISTSVAIESN